MMANENDGFRTPPGVECALWIDWDISVPARVRVPDRYSRLYFGHETCPSIMPAVDIGRDWVRAASDQGKHGTLVTPFLTPDRFDRWLALIDGLLEVDPYLEIVCSDWGLMHYLTEHQWGRPVLGRILAFQTTDPRLSDLFSMESACGSPIEALHVDGAICQKVSRPPPAALKTHYQSLWLTKPLVKTFFNRLGVQRCELNLPPAGAVLEGMSSWSFSVHVSDVLLTVMRRCPGPGEDFNRVAKGCPDRCHQEEPVEWHLPGDRLEFFRRHNGLYYRPARPNPMGSAVDRYVFRGGEEAHTNFS